MSTAPQGARAIITHLPYSILKHIVSLIPRSQHLDLALLCRAFLHAVLQQDSASVFGAIDLLPGASLGAGRPAFPRALARSCWQRAYLGGTYVRDLRLHGGVPRALRAALVRRVASARGGALLERVALPDAPLLPRESLQRVCSLLTLRALELGFCGAAGGEEDERVVACLLQRVPKTCVSLALLDFHHAALPALFCSLAHSVAGRRRTPPEKLAVTLRVHPLSACGELEVLSRFADALLDYGPELNCARAITLLLPFRGRFDHQAARVMVQHRILDALSERQQQRNGASVLAKDLRLRFLCKSLLQFSATFPDGANSAVVQEETLAINRRELRHATLQDSTTNHSFRLGHVSPVRIIQDNDGLGVVPFAIPVLPNLREVWFEKYRTRGRKITGTFS